MSFINKSMASLSYTQAETYSLSHVTGSQGDRTAGMIHITYCKQVTGESVDRSTL